MLQLIAASSKFAFYRIFIHIQDLCNFACSKRGQRMKRANYSLPVKNLRISSN